jgi:hypothetical protein
MVAPNDCSLCHTTANWNSTALPAGHMPNPANQGCNVCHVGAPSNYATLATNTVLHTGITSGCNTCHGAPNATPPVFYLNYTPKDAVLSPVHIPTAATPCQDCHALSFSSFSGTSMSSSKHALMFSVIGKTCDGCHESGKAFYGVNNLTTRPNGHHVGQDCSNCHNPNDWGGGAAAKKAAKAATRATVTTVVAAPSATSAVLPAGGASPSSSGAAAPRAAFSHFGVTASCASCHNGTLAQGKGASHLATNNVCENCHTASAWLPARFDHQGVAVPCAGCHNGVQGAGKPTHHVATSKDCGACHGTISWTMAAFTHQGISGNCRSCHNGVNATAKPPQHPITPLDCGSCHGTVGWLPAAVPAAPRRAPLPSPTARPGPSK